MTNMVKRSVFILGFVGLLRLFTTATTACTIVTASDGRTVLFGGNEDQKPNSSFLVVNTSGPFGVVYFATPWAQWPLVSQMGINEKGLCYDTNWIPREKLTPHPDKKAQHEWAIVQLMKECSTVEEVLSKIFSYNWGDSISYQVHFADKSGDAAVIHPGKAGELTYTRKSKEKGYLISTNFNLLQLDQGTWSCQRYTIADKMLSTMSADQNLSVEFMASVLNATHQELPYKTLYSAIYDLKQLKIYLYYDGKFTTPYVLDVKKELAQIPSYKKISLKELISDWDRKKEQEQ